jgi:AcrR family transcriptional regulator
VPAKKTKWQVKREASYLALVDSAMRQFHNRGYEKTRIEDILEGTGYTSGAFYFHFKNKADCFWHAIEHRQNQRGDWSQLTTGLTPETTPTIEILDRVFGHFTTIHEGMHYWPLVMVDFFNQHRNDPDQQERFEAVYIRWHAEIVRFVTALQHGGWVNPSRDPDTLATQLFAATEGFRVHTALYNRNPDLMGPALVELLASILKQPG